LESQLISIRIDINLPILWGTETFSHGDFGSINFIVGPNGTGKTLFADELRNQLNQQGILTRYLSADRLSGLEKSGGLIWHNPYVQGFSFDQFENMKLYGQNLGLGADAFVVLKERLDIRLKIEATLFQLFGRRMRLAEENGFLRPRLQRIEGGGEYKMREAEAHGLKELIVLLTFLYEDSTNCLIIDEPELHLHPQFQSFFIQEVRRIAGNPQQDQTKKLFFLITHSPYIVDVRTLEDLQHCIVFQPGKAPKAISLPDTTDEWSFRRLIPRLNTHHKQFFFATRPIFVEGYQDQQIFSLIQEKKGRMLGAAGVSFIDVGGKDELDVFFRLCSRLQINGQIVADLDALLEGRLRQSVIADGRCRNFASEQGLGQDLSKALGQLEREASDVAATLLASLKGHSELPPKLLELREALGRAEVSKQTRDRRYCALICCQAARAEIETSLPEMKDTIASLVGRINCIVEAFQRAGVFILRHGELENYLPSYTGNRYIVTDAAKAKAFEIERDLLLSDTSCGTLQVAERYTGLSELLDKATSEPHVELDTQLSEVIGDWIHKVQGGFRKGMLRDLDSLQNYASTEWSSMSRLITVAEFIETDEGFSCRIRLQVGIDPSEREITFNHKDVAASFCLPAKPASDASHH
jgi:hypothetical protein